MTRSPMLAMSSAALLFTAAAQATNGYFSLGYGVRAEAVAGADTALALDALTIASNPAGLAALQDGFDAGLDVFLPSRGATLTQGGQAAGFDGNDTRAFYIPALGLNRHLSPNVSWGLAVFGNGGLNTDYASNPYARFGAQGAAGVNLAQAFVSPALAWQYAHGQSLGVAVNLIYQQFEAKGLGVFSAFSASPANMSNRGRDSATGIGVRLGWRAELPAGFSLGASWQPKAHVGKFSKYSGLFADAGGFDVPQSWALGVGWKPNDAVTLSLDGQRIDYAQVASVGNPINSLFAGSALGSPNGPGFGWQNISVFKLGAQWRASAAFTLRAGISHSDQPVPSSQTFINILAPGVVRTHATIGAGFAVGAHGTLDLSLQHAFEETVHGAGSIPPAFGGGEADVRLSEDAVGLGYSQRL